MKIKKNIFGKLVAGMLIVGMTSCDFLDTTPSNFVDPETFYKNQEDCEMALAGIYWTLVSREVYGETYSCKLSNTDDLSFFARANQGDNVATNSHKTSNKEIWDVWVRLYSGINDANVFLENVDKANISDEKIKNRLKGEAKFLRAYYHFILTQCYYEVPVRKESVKDITSSMIGATSHTEALDWIIQEMDECVDMVDDELYDKSPSYVKKTTVQGILARVCLWRAAFLNDGEDAKKFYTMARDYAKAVKDSGKHKLIATDQNPDNIYLMWQNMARDKYDTDYNESMWEAEFVGNNLDGRHTEGWIGSSIGNLQKCYKPDGSGYSYAKYVGSLVLWNLYNEEDTDLRRDLALAPYTIDGNDQKKDQPTTKGIRYCGKYRREWEELTPKHKNNTPCNYPILRYADVLLMLAEAENEINNGPTALAYEAINAVRKRAQVSEFDEMDYHTFKANLQDERARELCFESLRKFDLIRWGIYYESITETLGNLINDKQWVGGTLQIAPQQFVDNTRENHIFLPIPVRELAVNSLMKQNKYWE